MKKRMFTIACCLIFLACALAWNLYGKKSSEQLSIKVIKQINNYSCGLACLVSILDYWDREAKQQKLLDYYPPNKDSKGYSLGSLKKIAKKKYKMNSYAMFSNFRFLRQQIEKGRPVMVALVVPHNMYKLDIIRKMPVYGKIFEFLTQSATFTHFVVVTSVQKNRVKVMDPLHGLKKLPKESFQAMWDKKDNAMLLVAA
mgnify:CR=1 FL=1